MSARTIAGIFTAVDGGGNAGENDGRLSQEELKSYLEAKNQRKSDEEIQSKVEQVLNFHKIRCLPK